VYCGAQTGVREMIHKACECVGGKRASAYGSSEAIRSEAKKAQKTKAAAERTSSPACKKQENVLE